MAIKGRSAEQKAALAEIVASETLLDIEEYIRPQFPPKRTSNEVLARENDLVNLNLYARRRIVQDGHGKWREVKPQLYSSNLQDLTSPVPSVKLKRRGDDGKTIPSRLVHCTESFNGSSVKTSGNYNNLSMTLRSNVFPGLGNNQWKTTTAKVFTEQPVIPTSERDKFCGIQSDEFGKWSAANVHHERMKKKWDAYLDTLPKQAGTMIIKLCPALQSLTLLHPKQRKFQG